MSDDVIRVGFTLLVLLVAAQRVSELDKSARNERLLRERGAREHAPSQMPFMRALHAGWLVAMIVETWAFRRTPAPMVGLVALGVFSLGSGLRLAAMRALGDRWNVKILTLPGTPPVEGGVFRHLRHPNYLGVVLEIAALPLVGGAFVTSIVFSLANAVLLRLRIRAEELALRQDNGYERMTSRPLLVPRWSKGDPS